jgi:hypothetical protein
MECFVSTNLVSKAREDEELTKARDPQRVNHELSPNVGQEHLLPWLRLARIVIKEGARKGQVKS